MLRLIGGCMIIIAGTMFGVIKSDALKFRARSLEKIISGLSLLETDISYGKRNLRDSLFAIGKNHGIDFFSKTASVLPVNGIKTALDVALTEENSLLEKDKAQLRFLGENLGMTDAGSQSAAIKRTILNLEEEKKEATSEYERLGKLYRSAGFLAGMLGAIILI